MGCSNLDDLSGRTLGTCTLERLIGQGGMGTVYLAQQKRPARHVAVKVLNSHFAMNSQTHQEFLMRFRREADVIARLEHVNILPIHEYGEQEGLTYLVMPYLSGGSLRDVLAIRGALPLSEALPYIQQAASALDYAHAQGIIHRDLKPANFLLHADGRLILADFGIAHILAGTSTGSMLTATGVQLGTPGYMAPEMIRSEAIDSSVDIYELGVVLFQILSGRLPFTGDTPYVVSYKHLYEPFPHLHTIKAEIPPGADMVIQKATAKQREDRYATAHDMVQALNNVSTIPLLHPEDGIPTVISPVQSTTTPPAEYQSRPDAATPTSEHTPTGNTSTLSTVPDVSSIKPVSSKTAKKQFRSAFIAIPLALLLIIGGVLLSFQLTKGNVNTKLYATSAPGCDTNAGNWVDYNGTKVTCEGSKATISNTAQSPQLQGAFLIQIPGHSYPSNYVVQAQLQQQAQSSSDFGLYFRNQPGNQQGVYTFLVHPNGTWNAYVYDNDTGAPTILTGGTFGDAHASVTLTVSVNGQEFNFYKNGKILGIIADQTYTSGTVGIAVDKGGTINASNFVLSTSR